MRRSVVFGALGLFVAAAVPMIIGHVADAESDDGRPKQSQEARTIDIGKVEEVDIDTSDLAEGEQVLTYPNSDYVKVHFSQLFLAPGDYLTVSDIDNSEVHRYDGTTESMWSTSISGDTAVVALHSESGEVGGMLSKYGARIDKVARGMTPQEMAQQERSQPQPESICGNDDQRNAVCYRSKQPKIYDNAAPVARLLIDGTTLCTAWRVGENNRLLTNNHCFDRTSQARNTEVWFNYECRSCNGTATTTPVKVRGDQVLDTDQTLDYTLFTVDDFDSIAKFGHLTLADRKAKANEKLYIPQHPSGQPRQIAMDSDTDEGACRVDEPVFDGYATGSDVSYYCDTEFGSSGSPVISRDTNEVIALHHFGGCPNSGVRGDLLLNRVGAMI